MAVGQRPASSRLTAGCGGATFLPPDQFLAMLMELEGAYKADKPRLYEQSRDLLQQRRLHARRVVAGGEVEASLVDRVSRIVAGSYDARNGGFGSDPKFTNPALLRFILHLYRVTGEDFYAAMVRKSLDAMAESPVVDDVEGGFFRYSSSADWSEPQREKLLEDNIQLARIYLDASIILEEGGPDTPQLYRSTAEKALAYVIDNLYNADRRGFHGSQGAHSEYFSLDATQRTDAIPPAVDPSCYTGPSALAAAALLDASWKLGRLELGRMALEVLDRIDEMSRTSSFRHVYSDESSDRATALLADWGGLLSGLMQAHASTAEARYLDRAVEVAAVMVDRFFDEDSGGFFDIEADADAVGHLQVREKPMPENMLAVQALLRLYQTTRNEDYRQICEATLSAFTGVFPGAGESLRQISA